MNFYFEIDSEDPVKKVDIYSVAGNLLGTYHQKIVPTADLKPGIYLVKVITEKGESFQRVVKDQI